MQTIKLNSNAIITLIQPSSLESKGYKYVNGNSKTKRAVVSKQD
jgi:hypothetical protein